MQNKFDLKILILITILILIFNLPNLSKAQPESSPEEFKVISVSPKNGTTDVPIDENIIITFNKPANESSIENAISIEPEISDIIFEWNDNSTTVNLEIFDFEEITDYTIIIKNSAKSQSGENLKESYI